jgi:hypothetical protein
LRRCCGPTALVIAALRVATASGRQGARTPRRTAVVGAFPDSLWGGGTLLQERVQRPRIARLSEAATLRCFIVASRCLYPQLQDSAAYTADPYPCCSFSLGTAAELRQLCLGSASGVQSAHIGTFGGVPVTTSAQAEIDTASRDLENAYREYERATQDLNSLPPIATHERAALTQRKVEAWNSLEAARMRYEDAQNRVKGSK